MEAKQQPAVAVRGRQNERTRGQRKKRQCKNKVIFPRTTTTICGVVVCHSTTALPSIVVRRATIAICGIAIGCTAMAIGGVIVFGLTTTGI
jgi:hypothetical protein